MLTTTYTYNYYSHFILYLRTKVCMKICGASSLSEVIKLSVFIQISILIKTSQLSNIIVSNSQYYLLSIRILWLSWRMLLLIELRKVQLP